MKRIKTLSSVDSTDSKLVLLLALNSGLGHQTRMIGLQTELQNRGVNTDLRIVEKDFQGSDLESVVGYRLIVVDCRDIDFSVELINSLKPAIIVVDNLSQSRWQLNLPDHLKNKLVFYDTLPHPKLDHDFMKIMNQILFDEQILQQKTFIPKNENQKTNNSRKKNQARICFYAGFDGFLNPKTISTIDRLCKDFPNYTRIGGNLPIISRSKYLNLISNSNFVITYPGLSFYESLFLNSTPVLIETKSEVHDQLSRYLAKRIGCAYLTTQTLFQSQNLLQMLVDDKKVSQSLDLDLSQWQQSVRSKSGISKLADVIEERLNDS